jgi:hypothetical protein
MRFISLVFEFCTEIKLTVSRFDIGPKGILGLKEYWAERNTGPKGILGRKEYFFVVPHTLASLFCRHSESPVYNTYIQILGELSLKLV